MRGLKYAATINDEALWKETDPDYELQYVDIGNVDSAGRIHEIADDRLLKERRAALIAADPDVVEEEFG